MNHRLAALLRFRYQQAVKSRSVLAIVLLIVGLFFAGCAANDPRPNIVFILTDDQRADTIGALGNEHIHTPHLDRLVQEGTTFTRAYCMGAQQGAVCVPSRAMLMSGRSLFRVDEKLDGQATWPEQFGKAGYRTFLTGKWHNGPESAARSFQSARAVFLGGMGPPFALPVQDLKPDGKFTEKRIDTLHSCAQFADAAIEFINQQKRGQPFLAYVAFNLPHDPRTAPPEHHARYETTLPPLPANFLPQHPFNNGDMTLRDEQLEAWPRTPEAIRQHLGDYYACVTYVDEQVGRILDALRTNRLAANTIVVFSSDHGLAIGSHGLMGKQNLYDHSMRSPLILMGPGIAKDKRSDAMTYLFDVFPTLGALGGVSAPEGSEGRSLAGVLAGHETRGRETIFTAYREVQRAVRDERWKLIAYPKINKVQLFDLQNDASETRDLAADPAYTAEVERLMGILQREQQVAADRVALRSENPLPAAFDFSKFRPAGTGRAP